MTKKSISMHIKNAIDVVFASTLIVAFFPISILISIAIFIESPGLVLFKQQRSGKDGKRFNVYKFRTMVVNAERIGLGYNTDKDDPRITKTGKFLRTWSIDEIPQLINVVKGEMSLVGPRPTLPYQVDAYTPHQRKRLIMKPGITGFSQVNGRNSIPWEKRIELDIWYVENWSLWLDARILLKTIKVILKRDSIYNNNGVNYDFRNENNSR